MKVKDKLKEILEGHACPKGSNVVMANVKELTNEIYEDLFMEEYYEDEEFE